ncbi:MAG: hypothetical protein RL148_1279 [Planctomycetota bacterium]|jgi:dinuclear metal center YbgI/SA1388 family protein
MAQNAPALRDVLDMMHEVAPLELAAEWDNTGLLVDPQGAAEKPLRACMLTIDCTEAVLREARRAKAGLVVSYHPPIFQPIKRLASDDARQRTLLEAVRSGIAVYSPHTALDAAPGGLADWLAEVVSAKGAVSELRPCGDGDYGRLVQLGRPMALAALLQRIRRGLGVKKLRIAQPEKPRTRIRSIAVAAGSGASVLRGTAADLWLTGEMGHHDVLAAVAAGTTVVLAEHTGTERGYLPRLRKRLLDAFDGALAVHVAKSDVDPVRVV